ncbi:MAG: hypothetical protein Ct9H300mP8_04560 [Gammaproteobacteria bacterium]|nr:MAG: hypothetical protein Ct9H300mP8_04560 [Gammaproteobacteria bacterium]
MACKRKSFMASSGPRPALNDDDAASELLRIYNEWLATFCDAAPGQVRRFG